VSSKSYRPGASARPRKQLSSCKGLSGAFERGEQNLLCISVVAGSNSLFTQRVVALSSVDGGRFPNSASDMSRALVAAPGTFQARLGWDAHLTPHDQCLWRGYRAWKGRRLGQGCQQSPPEQCRALLSTVEDDFEGTRIRTTTSRVVWDVR